jgi:hypothetical protein
VGLAAKQNPDPTSPQQEDNHQSEAIKITYSSVKIKHYDFAKPTKNLKILQEESQGVVKPPRNPNAGQYQAQLKAIWLEHLANTRNDALDVRTGDHS